MWICKSRCKNNYWVLRRSATSRRKQIMLGHCVHLRSLLGHCVIMTGWPTVLEFLEFLKLFWNFEKSHFFRLVLELFLNSEFLMSDSLGYNISGCPLFGSPICEKILIQFCPIICSWKMWKCSWNILELFWNFCKNSVGHPVMNAAHDRFPFHQPHSLPLKSRLQRYGYWKDTLPHCVNPSLSKRESLYKKYTSSYSRLFSKFPCVRCSLSFGW